MTRTPPTYGRVAWTLSRSWWTPIPAIAFIAVTVLAPQWPVLAVLGVALAILTWHTVREWRRGYSLEPGPAEFGTYRHKAPGKYRAHDDIKLRALIELRRAQWTDVLDVEPRWDGVDLVVEDGEFGTRRGPAHGATYAASRTIRVSHDELDTKGGLGWELSLYMYATNIEAPPKTRLKQPHIAYEKRAERFITTHVH